MNHAFVAFVESKVHLPGPVYEFGSYRVADAYEGLLRGPIPDVRQLFADREFVGCDMREGPGVDVVLDLVDTGIPADSVGTILLLDVLEHVEYARRAMEEVSRICAPGGVAVISTVMNFAIHSYPDDFWRYTPSGMRSLLRPFAQRWVAWVGEEDHPVSILAVAAGPEFDLPALIEPLDRWVAAQNHWHRAMVADGWGTDPTG